MLRCLDFLSLKPHMLPAGFSSLRVLIGLKNECKTSDIDLYTLVDLQFKAAGRFFQGFVSDSFGCGLAHTDLRLHHQFKHVKLCTVTPTVDHLWRQRPIRFQCLAECIKPVSPQTSIHARLYSCLCRESERKTLLKYVCGQLSGPL